MGKWIHPRGTKSCEFSPEKQIPPVKHTLRQIESFLKQVNASVREGKFTVLEGDPEDSRDTRYGKNGRFLLEYNLTQKEAQKQLLLSIAPEDFCHTIGANDHRTFYVFCIERELQKHLSSQETVAIYVKHDFNPDAAIPDVVISLHPIEHPSYLPFQD